MRTLFDYNMRLKSQRLADLKNKTAELERKLTDARLSLEREIAHISHGPEAAAEEIGETSHYAVGDMGDEYDDESMSSIYAAPRRSHHHDGVNSGGHAHARDGRTETLVSHGRRSAYYRGLSRRVKVTIGAAIGVSLVTVTVIIVVSGGASWPSSVAAVQKEITQACQNPNVKSEPGQVNFACAKTTSQVLWVFALMTSGDNPNFTDAKTGRLGLEPIAPAQGGELASFLNLHQPYNPADPVDSLEVAARAINNIIGGATVTGTDGSPVVQAGLESNSANCRRYTGSAALTSRRGFPSLCARPVTSQAGQAALVADVYKKWMVGAAPQDVRNVAVLFENSGNPGDQEVQAILKHLPASQSSA